MRLSAACERSPLGRAPTRVRARFLEYWARRRPIAPPMSIVLRHLESPSMQRYDTATEDAEASLKAASDETLRLEDEIAVLEEELERVESETPTTPEESAEWSRRVGEIDQKISDLQSDLRGAEEYLSNTHDYWFEEIDEDEDDE